MRLMTHRCPPLPLHTKSCRTISFRSSGGVCPGSFESFTAIESNGTLATAGVLLWAKHHAGTGAFVQRTRFHSTTQLSSDDDVGGRRIKKPRTFVSPLIAAERYAESSYFLKDPKNNTVRSKNKVPARSNNPEPSLFANNPRINKNRQNQPIIPPKKKGQILNYEINNWDGDVSENDAYEMEIEAKDGAISGSHSVNWDTSLVKDPQTMGETECESVISKNTRESKQYFEARAETEREWGTNESPKKSPEPLQLGRGPMMYLEASEAHRKKQLELEEYWTQLKVKQAEKEKGTIQDDEEEREVMSHQGTRIHPNDVPRLSEKYRNHLHHYERFIKREWLPLFPLGVNLERLRFDLANKMKRGNPYRRKKLDMEVVFRIAGEVARRADLVQLWRTDKGAVHLRPPVPKDQRVGPRRLDPHGVALVPRSFRPHLPRVEGYVADEWLPNLPEEGLGMNRLWSDLRLFVGGGTRGHKRVSKEIAKSIAANFARRGEMQMWKRGSGDILLTPPPPPSPVERSSLEEETM